jgi:hypothetical protein
MKPREIIRIDKDIFLVEGPSQYLKWSMNEGPNCVEFEGGPRICEGHDFQGGTVVGLKKSETSSRTRKAVEITVKNEAQGLGNPSSGVEG